VGSRSGSRFLALEPQREQLDGVDFERAFSKAMLHPPEEHLAQKYLTAQRQLRQIVLLILGEIALVSPSLQLSKPV
jgi:hypothetical protein